MQQDPHLRHILANSTEPAGAALTQSIMEKVLQTKATPSPYQPLVSATCKRRFLMLFVIISACTLLLSIAIGKQPLPSAGWTFLEAIRQTGNPVYLQLVLIITGMLATALVVQLINKKPASPMG